MRQADVTNFPTYPADISFILVAIITIKEADRADRRR
jgi:hypothetical protein